MSSRVIFKASAREDLDEQSAYYAREAGAELAHRFVTRVVDTAFWLADHPRAGRRAEFQIRGAGKIRVLPVKGFPKYLLFYQIGNDFIRVIRVVHGARNIGQVFSEEP